MTSLSGEIASTSISACCVVFGPDREHAQGEAGSIDIVAIRDGVVGVRVEIAGSFPDHLGATEAAMVELTKLEAIFGEEMKVDQVVNGFASGQFKV